MKNVKSLLIVLASLIWTSVAYAHATIGIFDLNRAVFNTDAWQQELRSLEENFSEDQETADGLRAELADLMESIEINAPTLSIAELQRMQEERQAKELQLRSIGERVQIAIRNSQNAFVERYRALLGDAVNEIYEDGGYDFILRSDSIVISGFDYDITAEVTARLNEKIASLAGN